VNTTEKKITRRRLISGGLTFVTILIVLYILVKHFDLGISDILNYTPQNKILAGFVFQLFYAIKSLTVFFPLPVLQLAVGHLFPTSWALVVNFCGILVAVTCPFILGWHKGEQYVTAVVEKVDAIEKIKSLQSDNVIFSTYIIRMLQLPLDLVSLFLGSEHISYPKYLAGSLLGLAPVTIAITLLGETITDIKSPQFLFTLLLMVIIIGTSLFIFWLFTRHHRKEQESGI
jgi:uncharacterized membrane protein YdjX (TVP38/TMEM64 family)